MNGTRTRRPLAAVAIGLVLALMPVGPAQARMDAGGAGELGLLIILLVAKGAQLIVASSRTDANQPPTAAPAPGHVAPAAPASDQVSAEPEPSSFNARPHCGAVGGYEIYFRRTGRLCRLH